MYLRDNGASYENVQDLFKSNIQEYRKEASFGDKIEIYRNCMAIALNPNGKDNSDRIMAAKVADNLLGLEDVSASFVLVQIDNVVHISARSNGTVNVQLILEKLNGGGRYDPAGAQVKGTGVADTLFKLKEAIDGYINPED
jgi:c-di-AMP phosphodiesterase-like protein